MADLASSAYVKSEIRLSTYEKELPTFFLKHENVVGIQPLVGLGSVFTLQLWSSSKPMARTSRKNESTHCGHPRCVWTEED